jgi:hypothetical protein
LAGAGDERVPTLAPRVVAAFAPAGPGGWPRVALAAWLAAVPLLAWWRPRRRGAWPVALAAALVGALGLAQAALRPLAHLLPLRRADGTTAWIVHGAAPRPANLSIALPSTAVARPLVSHLSEIPGLPGAWADDRRTLEDVVLRAGARTAWELLDGPTEPPRVTGRLLADRLLVANETGRALPACLLARNGALHDCGPLAAAEVRTLEVARPPAGPLATLTRLAARLAPDEVRALRVAVHRVDPRVPTLLALDPGDPGAPPALDGATVRRLPAVLVVPIP